MIKSAPEIKINRVDFNGNVTRMSCSQDLQASGRASLSLALGHDDSCPKIGEEVEISHRGRTLFVGPIIGANISINVTPTGAKQEFAELEVANFLYPLTTAEIRRTPIAKSGELIKISNKALMESLKENPILNLVKKSLKKQTAADALSDLLNQFRGYPTSFVAPELEVEGIKGQPHPKSFAGAYTATHNTVWSLITQTFAPHPLFELFPIIRNSKKLIIYRYKPVDPSLYSGKIGSTKYYLEWFEAQNIDYQRINTPIISMSLMYNDMDRMNAVHHSLPHEAEGSADNLLFGVQGVPVVNIDDINKFGLRASTFPTPFISLDDNKQKFHRYAASAFSERTYLTFGEGEKYAIARVVIEYDETLLPGVWVEIDEYVGYVTEVMHDININNRGMLSGFTSLSLERVRLFAYMYEGRIVPEMNPTFDVVPLKKREGRPKGKKTKKSPKPVQAKWSVTDETPAHPYQAIFGHFAPSSNSLGYKVLVEDIDQVKASTSFAVEKQNDQYLFKENNQIIFALVISIQGSAATLNGRNITVKNEETNESLTITASNPITGINQTTSGDYYLFTLETSP